MTGFRFVDEHQAEHHVTDLCRVAGVSRSGFYAWKTRQPGVRARANEALLVEIREIHETSRRTYGAPRVTGQLRRSGRRVGHNRVAKLMAAHGLVGAHARRKFRRGRHPRIVPAPDLLQRDFTAAAPNRRWVADITEFACWDGKLYLAGIKDLCDRSLVGWSMGERQTTDLVIAALVMGLGRRGIGGELVHHADHGTQYTSLEFTNRLHDCGLVGSYGSVGGCFDNSAMESFWATMKTELRHIWGPFNERTRSEMRTIVFDYIETFYNRNRHQAGLGHRTPSETYRAAVAG